MATSGGQPGNQNGVRAKRVREAILRALARKAGTIDAGLDKAADKLVQFAIDDGKDWALIEMFNRLDGKPATIIVGDDESPPVQITGRIRLVRPDP